MKSYLQWKLATFYLVERFNEEHSDELDEIEEYAPEKVALEQAVTKILVAAGIQGRDNTGLRDNSVASKRSMAETVVQYGRKGLPLARRADRKDLIVNLNKSVSYIFRPDKVTAVSRARNVRKTLAEHGDVLTNITTVDIAILDESIATFEDNYMKPKIARSHKKVYGTQAYKKLFADAMLAVQNMYDYVVGYFMVTNHVMVEEFEAFMAVEKEGVRHTGLIVFAKDKNPAEDAVTDVLQGVNLKIVELNLVAKTNIRGIGAITKFMQGTYHVEFWAEGFKKIERIIHFKQGRMAKVDLKMERE